MGTQISNNILAVFTPTPEQAWMFAGPEGTAQPVMEGRFVITGDTPETAKLCFVKTSDGPYSLEYLTEVCDVELAATQDGWDMKYTVVYEAPLCEQLQRERVVTLVSKQSDGIDPLYEIAGCREIIPEVLFAIGIDERAWSYLRTFFRRPAGRPTAESTAIELLGRRVLVCQVAGECRYYTDDSQDPSDRVETSRLREIDYIAANTIAGGHFFAKEPYRPFRVSFTMTARSNVHSHVNGQRSEWMHYEAHFPDWEVKRSTFPSREQPPSPRERQLAEMSEWPRSTMMRLATQPIGYQVNPGETVATFEVEVNENRDVLPAFCRTDLTDFFVITMDAAGFHLEAFPANQQTPNYPSTVKSTMIRIPAHVVSAAKGFRVSPHAGSKAGFDVLPRMDAGRGYYATNFTREDPVSRCLDPQVLVQWAKVLYDRQPSLFEDILRDLEYVPKNGMEHIGADLQDVYLSLAIISHALAAVKGVDAVDSISDTFATLMSAEYHSRPSK